MAKDDILKKASQKLGELVSENEAERKRPEQDRRDFISALSKEIGTVMVKMLSPLIAGLTMQSKQDKADIMKAIASIDVKVPPIASPQVKLPTINVPTPRVTVNPPQVKVPQINVPKTEIRMPDTMNVRMESVNNKAPLPVIMMDTKGKPMPFSMGTGGGGRSDFITIKDIRTSAGASLINDAGQLKTDAGTPTLSLDYGSGEIGSETVRMVMATDAIASVNIVSGSSSGTEYSDGDTASTPAGGVIMGDTGEESSNVWAVAIGEGATGSNSVRVVQATDAVSSVVVNSGTITAVTDITNSVSTYQLDGDGNYRGTFPIEGDIGTVTAVTDITNSVATYSLDGDGNYRDVISVQEQGTPGVVGTVAHDSADSGNPIKIGFKAVTSNPAAVADADRVDGTADKYGRQLVRYSARDLLSTAYISLVDSSEDTLIAASSGNFLDLVWVMCANESDGAVNVDFRDLAGGNVVTSVTIPANGTAGISPSEAIMQGNVGNPWTAQNDLADQSNTTINITAMFRSELG